MIEVPTALRPVVQTVQRTFARAEKASFDRGRSTVGERVGRAPVLILVTTGRRTGLQRRTPLVYFERAGELIISGGAGGVPWDPDWVLNLRSCPAASVEQAAAHSRPVEARELLGVEKQAIWHELCLATPRAARYQRRRKRPVPVFMLRPPPFDAE